MENCFRNLLTTNIIHLYIVFFNLITNPSKIKNNDIKKTHTTFLSNIASNSNLKPTIIQHTKLIISKYQYALAIIPHRCGAAYTSIISSNDTKLHGTKITKKGKKTSIALRYQNVLWEPIKTTTLYTWDMIGRKIYSMV